MPDDKLLDELVEEARAWEAGRGLDFLVAFEDFPSACGCMGPQDGRSLCPCRLRAALARHLPIVLDRMGHRDEALRVMRTRFVTALSA